MTELVSVSETSTKYHCTIAFRRESSLINCCYRNLIVKIIALAFSFYQPQGKCGSFIVKYISQKIISNLIHVVKLSYLSLYTVAQGLHPRNVSPGSGYIGQVEGLLREKLS